MNGTVKFKLPKFLEGEPLPPNYTKPQNPYEEAPACHYNIRELGNYLEKMRKDASNLTREELNMFRTDVVLVEECVSYHCE